MRSFTMDQSVHLQDLFLQAKHLTRSGSYTKAVDVLRRIIREAPDFGKAYGKLGWIYDLKFQKYEEAEEFYKLALDYHASYHETYYHYAALLSRLKRFEELEPFLERALRVPGINKGILINERAIMNELRGEYSWAIELYRDSIRYSLNQKDVEDRFQSIERCRRKMNIFGGTHVSDN